MATVHVIGQDLVVDYVEGKGKNAGKITITIDNVKDLVETAKMKLAVSTSGYQECGFMIDGIPVKMNLQLGINKPKSEHWDK